MDKANITEIELFRGPCLGTCPVFEIKITRAGSFRYDGSWYVEPLGKRTGGFPGYLFERLAEVCCELRILELDDVYPSDMEDAPLTAVKIRHTDGVKVVRSDGGNTGPVRLWAFAVIVEHAMREAFAIDDRKKGKR